MLLLVPCLSITITVACCYFGEVCKSIHPVTAFIGESNHSGEEERSGTGRETQLVQRQEPKFESPSLMLKKQNQMLTLLLVIQALVQLTDMRILGAYCLPN